MSNLDRKLLLRAVQLADEHMRAGAGGPFGAVIACGSDIIAEGWNEVTSGNDPTAHAEVVAIRRAATARNAFSLDRLTIYASCEPCPMCLGAIYWARLGRLVFAATRADAAKAGFDDDLIYREVALPIAARTLPTERLPLAEADHVMRAWQDKADRIRY